MNFKKFRCGAVAVMALAVMAVSAMAQGFSGTGTAVNFGPTNISYYVISPNSGSGSPIVQMVQASLLGSEISNANARVQFYKPTIDIVPQSATDASSTTISASTNGLAANDVLVFHKKSPESFQRLTVASLSGSTITVNETITAAQTTSDRFYKMTLAGKLRGGNSLAAVTFVRDTISEAGQTIWVGTAGKPNLVEAWGTNAPTLNVVAGRNGFPQ